MCALWGSTKAEDGKRRAMIAEMLRDIRDQRSKMKLAFAEDVTSIKNVAATLLDYDINSLTVEVSSLKGVSPTWIGAGVSCFFRIKDREFRNQEHFMTFDTKIVAVEQQSNGTVQFALALPTKVQNAQQRRGVRVKVDMAKVPAFLLWRTPDTPRDLRNVPPLFGEAQYKGKLVKVDNFSASGLRLLVGRQLLREALPEAGKGDHLSVFFQAVEEAGGKSSGFWVESVLRNVFHDPETSETALGLEFVAEGYMDVNKDLLWRPLRFDEVTGLGKFIFKWNLDLYREKGLGG